MELNKLSKLTIKVVKLLSGGIFTSIGLIVLASDKLSFLSTENSLFFIKYYQWELFGLTVAKIGLDQVNYAIVVENNKEQLDINFYTIRSIFLIILFCFVSYFFVSFLSIKVLIILFFTLALDVYSIISLSTYNALGKYNVILTSSLLNYPFFFVSLLLISLFTNSLTFVSISILFLFSSLTRFLYLLFLNETVYKKNLRKKVQVNYKMLGLQQILNYFLFKGDQILISFINEGSSSLIIINSIQSQILFYTRLPEIYTSITTGISSLYLEKASNYIIQNKVHFKFIFRIGLFFIICSLVIFYFYSKIMGNSNSVQDSIFYWLSYSIQLLLIVPANIITFTLFRRKDVKFINKRLILSLIITLIVVLCVINFGYNLGEIIKYIVPMQLFIYVCLFFLPKSFRYKRK